LYQVADDLDMAVCFHTGSGIPNSRATRTRNTAQGSRVPFANLPETFSAVITNKLPQKFPHIRWGFIEAASGWIPYELYRINRRLKRLGEQPRNENQLGRKDLPEGFEVQRDTMREFNLFVTCLIDEDLPYILQFAGEDN